METLLVLSKDRLGVITAVVLVMRDSLVQRSSYMDVQNEEDITGTAVKIYTESQIQLR